IGGGLPVGACGGRRDLMEMISPSGPVYQAGTLSGNPLAMAAGIATLEILKEPGTYETLEERSKILADGLRDAAAARKLPLAINRVGSMFTTFFTKDYGKVVNDFADATSTDTRAFAKFFHAMLENGIYLPPSPYEAWFLGLAHSPDAVKETIIAAEESFALIR